MPERDAMEGMVAAVLGARRGLVVAPAGCGKTYLIAKAIGHENALPRQLILTHTHAGVSAIRRQLKRFGVSSSRARIETISSWALRYASSYPRSSGLAFSKPETHAQWEEVYRAAAILLRDSPIRRVVEGSYAGVFVDEYQDCSVCQHELVLTLAGFLPCRILGDPLQGVFQFTGSVDWATQVIPNFEQLPGLEKAWRWEQENANRELGQWLLLARQVLERGEDLSLRNAPISWKRLDPRTASQAHIAECKRFAAKPGESVVAINKWPNQHHNLTARLDGLFTCVEAIECEDLLTFATEFEQTTGPARAASVLEFAASCMTQVRSILSSAIGAYSAGRMYQPRNNPKAAHLLAIKRVAEENALSTIELALETIGELRGNRIHRRELLEEMIRALREYRSGQYESLRDAAWQVRNRTRHQGRNLGLRVAGSTLLVKGMEFHHAVVLNADQLNRQELYVAMTRGCRSLTIFSSTEIIRRA